ncbi:peptidylprolyl isomerase [Salipaludibacillus neizhouensis]|uniref:Peptidylprolyl isomerase n=1 Tax=Salipaludibacillus neizhouensis TaxID=885475 RepID=A0A3A9K803_9BACI|nr:SurA N-terminal domain-containing protein [Salipaludibacillus neizhouensis]RKL67628.1 peptidylprolyl isomerase [Salipaludibacillus neizhouensis]
MKRFTRKTFLAIPLAGVLLLAACGGNETENNTTNNGANNNETATEENEATNTEEVPAEDNEAAVDPETEAAMPEPDLEGIPDVVAEVNGEEIAKEEFVTTYEGQFQQIAMQSQMSGQELDQDQLKTQVAESMIGTELLIQEAENAGFEASQEEIDETLEELATQFQLESKEEFMTLMQEQGMEEEEIMTQLEMQVKVDQLIASEAGDIEPTEEELQEYYDQIVAQQEQMSDENSEEVEIPSFDEVKPEIEKQLKSQKESEVYQTLIERLREEADVTINL